MIVRRALKNSTVVAGGGAIDVCLLLSVRDQLNHSNSLSFPLIHSITLVADGDQSIFEAACTHNSWEVSAFYQLICQSS